MERDLLTPGDRIRWAVDNCGRTLEDLADALECTHSALSQWQTNKTNMHNVKAGLLVAFARETRTSLDWLLTGNGPRITGYSPAQEAPLVRLARHIAADLPQQAHVAEKLLQALEPDPPSYGAKPTAD